MKIKIFEGDDITELQDKVNHFIAENFDIYVRDLLQSTEVINTNVGQKIVLVITVLYVTK